VKNDITDAELEIAIMGDIRAQVEERFWKGKDIVEVQMRSVAEAQKLEKEAKEDIQAAKERLDKEAYMLALKAMVGVLLRLNKEFPGKKLEEIGMEDARRYLGVVAVIIASGEGTRYSPAFGTHKGMESIYGAPNIHQVWQAVEAMSLGAKPVLPIGMRYLGLMLKDVGDFKKVTKMGGIVPEELLDEDKKANLVPRNAILSKKGSDEEGGHGNQLKYAMEAYKELGLYDTVGHFQVHFAEHSPLALDKMVNSAWVGYLEHLFGSAYDNMMITATSRQDSTIAKKGNFIYACPNRIFFIINRKLNRAIFSLIYC
jgi:hypothetical protein